MNSTESLCLKIDKCISSNLDSSVVRIHAWHGESDLNFALSYKFSNVEIEIWRDRGLFSVMLSTPNNSMFHTLEKFTKHLNLKGHFEPAEQPEQLSGHFTFIKENYSRILETLNTNGSDQLLDQVGIFRSIAKKKAKCLTN